MSTPQPTASPPFAPHVIYMPTDQAIPQVCQQGNKCKHFLQTGSMQPAGTHLEFMTNSEPGKAGEWVCPTCYRHYIWPNRQPSCVKVCTFSFLYDDLFLMLVLGTPLSRPIRDPQIYKDVNASQRHSKFY
jgi:hypothetical protein